jgi:hypothetical protein
MGQETLPMIPHTLRRITKRANRAIEVLLAVPT